MARASGYLRQVAAVSTDISISAAFPMWKACKVQVPKTPDLCQQASEARDLGCELLMRGHVASVTSHLCSRTARSQPLKAWCSSEADRGRERDKQVHRELYKPVSISLS